MSRLRINKFGIFSVAKMYSLIMFVVSLLIAIPYGLIIIALSLMGSSSMRSDEAWMVGGGGIVAGIAIMIILPIIYAIIGFIAGAIGAILYNIFAGIIGGIEIEVDGVA